MNISYLLGRSSQAHPSGLDAPDLSQEATARRLRHYRDIQLPGMTGEVPPLKELTHPSKLNKRSRSSKGGGEEVELEEEPSRQRRRFDSTEVKGYLAGLKRKQMLLRQDSNPQEVPGSPLLPLYPYSSSSSVTGFRHGEVSGEYPSLHDAEPTLDPSRSGPTIRNKGLVSVTREDAQSSSYGTSYGDMHCFPRSPTVCPPFLTISEFDPGLRHLLGGTVSPAVASTPSPTTTTTTAMKTSMYPASSSPPLVQQQLYRYLDDSEAEAVTDIVVGGGVGELEVECPETTNVVVAGGDDQELVEDLSETPILPSFHGQGQLHVSPTLPYVLPNDSPPPSLSLLLSQAFSHHNQVTAPYPSQTTSSNLQPSTRETHSEGFNATTFSISHYYPREE